MTGLVYRFDVVPWFLPGLALTVVLSLVLMAPLARRTGESGPVVWLLLVGLGAIVAATLTPVGSIGAAGVARACDFERMRPVTIAELTSLTDASLNVFLFIPLGLAIAQLRVPMPMAAVLGGAVALPFAIEGLQRVAPLGRSCQSGDVIDNLTGLVLGLTVGLAVRGAMRIIRRRGPTGP